MSLDFSLTGLLRQVVNDALRSIFVARPARVEDFDAETMTVTVTPVLKETVEGLDQLEVVESPRVEQVPVVWPRAGDWFLSAPLQQGDYVLLVCADRSIDIWQERGGVVDPIDLRRHNITDAIAIPGVYPKPDSLTEEGTDSDMIMGRQGGALVRIRDDGTIEIGSTDGTKQPIALADDVKAELDAIKAELDSLSGHSHSYIDTMGAGASTTGPGPTLSYSPSEVGSSKITVEE